MPAGQEEERGGAPEIVCSNFGGRGMGFFHSAATKKSRQAAPLRPCKRHRCPPFPIPWHGGRCLSPALCAPQQHNNQPCAPAFSSELIDPPLDGSISLGRRCAPPPACVSGAVARTRQIRGRRRELLSGQGRSRGQRATHHPESGTHSKTFFAPEGGRRNQRAPPPLSDARAALRAIKRGALRPAAAAPVRQVCVCGVLVGWRCEGTIAS